MIWFHNLRRLWSGAEWFYISRLSREYLILTNKDGNRQLAEPRDITLYYAACNTSGAPHWYPERGRADTVHKSQIHALLKTIREDWTEDIRVWTKEEFEKETKERIAEECT